MVKDCFQRALAETQKSDPSISSMRPAFFKQDVTTGSVSGVIRGRASPGKRPLVHGNK